MSDGADEGAAAFFRHLGPAAFAAPNWLAPSAWIEHVPFAFWVAGALRPEVFVELGTHHGTSYFAFCQELRRQGRPVFAHAVDTWKGDEHAGFYGEEIWKAVDHHNRAAFADFSTLHRETFAAALGRFPEGSVDLLHIDGLHSFEAVSADFEGWLPKMSSRGMVVLHDSQVHERGFGVHRLVADLRRRFPLFEFAHGHGLAVVGVGRDLPPALRALLAAEAEPKAKTAIEALFARLGRACLLELKRRHPPAPVPAPPDRGLDAARKAIRGLTAGEPSPAVVAAISGSDLFDPAWYAAQVPGLAHSGIDPARHYALFGPLLGIDPGSDFDAAWYLDNNPDVAAAGVNPLGHYELYGRGEGRPTRDRIFSSRALPTKPCIPILDSCAKIAFWTSLCLKISPSIMNSSDSTGTSFVTSETNSSVRFASTIYFPTRERFPGIPLPNF